MAHEITQRADGTAEAAFAVEPAWHGLGTILDHPMTSAEALTAARLDWRVAQREIGYIQPVTIDTSEGQVERREFRQIDGQLANVREDNGFFLGMVSEAYQVIQNVDAFAFLDSLIAEHQMTYESAFSLNGGKRVILLARLPKSDVIVPGDATLRYCLLSLHHDGGGAIKFGPCATRVVCANTYAVALGEGTIGDLSASGGLSKETAIRHLGDVSAKLDVARKMLFEANQSLQAHAEASRQLAAHRMTADEWDAFLDIMCPQLDSRDPDWTEKRAERIDTTRKAIIAAYHNERQMLPGIEQTAWSAFNAVTEHIDHLPRRGATRERKSEARFNVCLYGAGRDMKVRAFEAACRFAGLSLAT